MPIGALARGTRSVLVLAVAALLAGAARHAPKPNVVIVAAHDFALSMPASIPAGVTTFRLLNKGKQIHHMSIFRLDDGKTAAEGLKALMVAGQGPRPAWLHPVGGPQAAMPRAEANATVVLEPGNYLAFCEVPGPDPAPHFAKGMAKAFTVTGPARPDTLPTADVQLSLTDYDFIFAKPLSRGRHTVAVTNSAAQGHMVVLVRFPRGKGIKEFLDWSMDPKGKLAPGRAMGGVAEIGPGQTASFTENFTPGHYGMICFTADSRDGKPHFLHGMQKEFDIP